MQWAIATLFLSRCRTEQKDTKKGKVAKGKRANTWFTQLCYYYKIKYEFQDKRGLLRKFPLAVSSIQEIMTPSWFINFIWK